MISEKRPSHQDMPSQHTRTQGAEMVLRASLEKRHITQKEGTKQPWQSQKTTMCEKTAEPRLCFQMGNGFLPRRGMNQMNG